jgi:hypothetical protein
VVFYLFQVHKVLLYNKEIIDKINSNLNESITSLRTNQAVLSSDIKSLKHLIHQNDKKVKKKFHQQS